MNTKRLFQPIIRIGTWVRIGPLMIIAAPQADSADATRTAQTIVHMRVAVTAGFARGYMRRWSEQSHRMKADDEFQPG